ncbi:MAG: hypothetical protein JHC33_02855 [Ignisphaera sp.]|nr:hypothetical protein [Ignisphaera sp.]
MGAVADRVKETTTTTGTGTISLGGAVTSFRTFSSAFVSGQKVFYTIENGASWEVGEGTVTSGTPWTLSRDTVLDSSTGSSLVSFTTGSTVYCTRPAVATRELLTAARTYYVATTGSDSNNGLSVSTPFLTIQKAINTVCSLDMGAYQVTIQVADGTYTNTSVGNNYIGTLPPIIQGNTTTPANCILSTTSSDCLAVNQAIVWNINGFTLKTTTSGNGLNAQNGGIINFQNIVFGACATAHINAQNSGIINCQSNYTITGSYPIHWKVIESGVVWDIPGKTITITGTPAFSTAFLYMRTASIIVISNNTTFTGSATGVRYSINLNSACFVNGAATTYLPGNTSGTTATGGQYA